MNGTEELERLRCEDVGRMWDCCHRDIAAGPLCVILGRGSEPFPHSFIVQCIAEIARAVWLPLAVHFTGLTAVKRPEEIYCASVIFNGW